MEHVCTTKHWATGYLERACEKPTFGSVGQGSPDNLGERVEPAAAQGNRVLLGVEPEVDSLPSERRPAHANRGRGSVHTHESTYGSCT